jgi:hypothetical protein
MILHDRQATMNQKIFAMDLPMETVSLYLLCCALTDAGTPLSTRTILTKWNAAPEVLAHGLDTLVQKKILGRIISDQKGNDVYQVRDVTEWEIDV